MTNELATLNKNNRAIIEREVGNDPLLKSHHTQRQYKNVLAIFEDWRAGRPMTKTLVEQYAAELQAQGKAPSTINQKLAAVRWWARKVGDLAQDGQGIDPALVDVIAKQAARVASVKDVRGERPQRGRHINSGELAALLRICEADPTAAGRRDTALIAMAWATGARRDELARLTLADMTPDESGDMMDLNLRGKGDKPRKVFVNNGARAALVDWLTIRGNQPGPVFCRINKGGKVASGEGLSGEALRVILDKRIDEAKIQPITWHDFRRTFAGNLWEAGIDGVTIQKLMGHASQNQTASYDRRPEESRRQAIKVLHVPYQSKRK